MFHNVKKTEQTRFESIYDIFLLFVADKDKIISKLLQIEPMASNRKTTAKIIEQMELKYD